MAHTKFLIHHCLQHRLEELKVASFNRESEVRLRLELQYLVAGQVREGNRAPCGNTVTVFEFRTVCPD